MKKLQNIFIISAFATVMFAFYGGLILWVSSCEDSYKEEILTEFKEVKIKFTLDSLYKWGGVERNLRAGDGNFKMIWVADGFNNQNKWFFDSLCNRQEAFIKTVAPYDSLWSAGKLSFERIVAKGNFNCVVSGFEGGLDCNWSKINRAVLNLQPDHVHIFSYNQGYGTGNGGVSVTGVGNESLITAPWQCSYFGNPQNPGRTERISQHEIEHGCECGHDFTVVNIMYYATNGGCELGATNTATNKQIILNHINSRIN